MTEISLNKDNHTIEIVGGKKQTIKIINEKDRPIKIVGKNKQSVKIFDKTDPSVKVSNKKNNTIKVVNRRENIQLKHAGKTGNGIVSIIKTNTVGVIDTYTITYSDSTTSTFELTNGIDGTNPIDGTDGFTPYIQNNYWYIDGVNTNIKALGIDGYTPIKGIDYFDGIDGSGDSNFTKTFNVSSMVDVNHNLNKLVSISVIDSANDEVIGDINYIDLNNIKVTFRSAFSGTITCN